ncbi:MAG: hypothetical protein MPJ25_00920 [Pirellulales bacterium]|nr:hypothetical protein [Pirellulales bacterium]
MRGELPGVQTGRSFYPLQEVAIGVFVTVAEPPHTRKYPILWERLLPVRVWGDTVRSAEAPFDPDWPGHVQRRREANGCREQGTQTTPLDPLLHPTRRKPDGRCIFSPAQCPCCAAQGERRPREVRRPVPMLNRGSNGGLCNWSPGAVGLPTPVGSPETGGEDDHHTRPLGDDVPREVGNSLPSSEVLESDQDLECAVLACGEQEPHIGFESAPDDRNLFEAFAQGWLKDSLLDRQADFGEPMQPVRLTDLLDF